MNITYWTGYSKKKNSTTRPTSGTDATVTLKDDCSILNPVFDCAGVPDNVNYIYVSDFGRYYFVSDVVHITADRIQIHCSVDVLASYKSQIGGYTAFVERSASSYNLNISDALIKSTTEIVQSEITQGDTLGGDYDYNGTIVALVVGKNGMKKYALSMSDLAAVFNTSFDATLASYFDTTNPFADAKEALQALFCSIASPAQYVKSVKWFPMSLASGTSEIPYFGFVGAVNAEAIVKETGRMGGSATRPSRYYNDFRDFDSRFTSASIFLPGVGVVNLDPKHLQHNITFTYYADSNTGACDVDLFADQSEIGHYTCNIGIDIPIGGVSGANPVGQIFSAGMAALSFNPVGVMSSLKDAISDTLQPPATTTGANGNRKVWDERPFVQISVTRLGSTGLPTTQHGREKATAAQISSLSGYIQCSGASVTIPGYDTEKDAVNGYLNSGFFYE